MFEFKVESAKEEKKEMMMQEEEKRKEEAKKQKDLDGMRKAHLFPLDKEQQTLTAQKNLDQF